MKIFVVCLLFLTCTMAFAEEAEELKFEDISKSFSGEVTVKGYSGFPTVSRSFRSQSDCQNWLKGRSNFYEENEVVIAAKVNCFKNGIRAINRYVGVIVLFSKS